MRRRSFLGFLAGAAASLAAPSVWGAAAPKIKAVTRDALGTTLRMELDHAPFPEGGASYTDPTVFVFVPEGFGAESSARRRSHRHLRQAAPPSVPMLVHFHGHRTMAERAMIAHALREQLVDSKQNAILVVPQGPVMVADSACGKLETPGGLARMLDEVLETLAASSDPALVTARITTGARRGTVCLSAHSGGYHAVASCLRSGGVEINEVYLFDALYGEADAFRDWVVAGKGLRLRERHKLVSYYGSPATEAQNNWLRSELEKADVRCALETVEGTLSRQDLSRSEAVFVRTQVPHGEVTSEFNELRDCLYGSGLPRHVRTAWFDDKSEARQLERRR